MYDARQIMLQRSGDDVRGLSIGDTRSSSTTDINRGLRLRNSYTVNRMTVECVGLKAEVSGRYRVTDNGQTHKSLNFSFGES